VPLAHHEELDGILCFSNPIASVGVDGYILRAGIDRWEVHFEISDDRRTWVQRGRAGRWEVWSTAAVPPRMVDRFQTALLAAVKRIPERHELRHRFEPDRLA
jgi:hypothetical protein